MPLFGSAKAVRSTIGSEPEPRASLAHALISLEKRYVFDAALASELTDLAGARTIHHDDVSAPRSLAETLIDASHPVSVSPVETHRDTSVLDTSGAATGAHAVYFIDGNVEHKDVLIAGLPAGADIVVLDPTRDGVQQIAEAMATRSGIDQIHVFAHGAEGSMSLGSTVLEAATMSDRYGAALAGIGSHLTQQADILVYACDFAEGADGRAAADLLASLTGADVAASTDLTGATSRGGDWTLEYSTGTIESHAVTVDAYDGTLAVAAISASGLPTTNGLHNLGASATWSNVATVGGQPVDIRATVVSADAGATITFGTTGDDLRMELENGTARVAWEIFAAGTTNPVSADVNFQITDLDGPNIEYVSASTGYTVEAATNLAITTSGPVVTAAGTQNQNSETVSMIRFSWASVSSMTVDYTATSGNDIRIFNHDGDLDLAFANPVTVAPPVLDLDTGTVGSNYHTTFTENGAAVSVTDPTVDITNSTNITGATVTLTNAKAADGMALGALPPGISGAVDTSVAGQITVTLTGTASAASYETALHNITFSNSSDTPDTTQRIVTFQLEDTIYSSTTTTTTIEVVPVDDPPVAVDDGFSTTVNNAVSGSVAGNDSDPEGDTLSFSVATQPGHGSVSMNAAGGFTYTPTGGWAGTDTFTYTADDGNGGTDTATVTVIVQGPPVAVDDTFSTAYATPLNGSVAGNDSDPNGDTLTYTVGTTTSHGSLTLNANGSFSYTPTGGYSGPDTFTYSVSDGHGGTASATATITVGNGAPVAVDDTFSTAYATPLNGSVAGNDSDPNGDTLSYTLGTTTSHGSLTLNANGSFAYTPSGGYSGPDTFTYSVSDGHGGTAGATATITVGNGAPVAVDDTFSTAYATPLNASVAGNDSDPNGDTLSYTLGTGPSHGSLTLNANGSFTYTPTGGYNGPDTFTYSVSDGHGGTASATANITVNADPNAPPVAVDDSFSTAYATPLNGSVAGNDSDPNGDTLTYTLGTGPSHGSLTLNANGSFAYTPTGGYSGPDTFTYSVSDGRGGTANATATITVGNGAPVAVDDTFSTAYATPLNGSVAGNDSDPNGDTLTYSVATGPSHGSLTLNANGSLSYTPTGGYSGADTFTYTVSDGHGGTASATASITVAVRPNNAPVAVNDSVNVTSGNSVSGNAATNDTDADGDTLTYALGTSPAHGSVTLNANGTFDYTPTGGYHGTDTFTYTVNDGFGGTATATVTINVNAPPAIAVIPAQTNTDAQVASLDVGALTTDPDGPTLTYSATGLPPGLTIDTSTGRITGTIDRAASQAGPGGSGTYTVDVTASDGAGGTTTRTFTWTVTNPAPIAADDTASTPGGTTLHGSVTANDSDPDGDTLSWALNTGAAHGTVTVAADGSFTYVPTAGYVGTDAFTYRVTDAQGASATATVTVTVADRPPTAVSVVPAQSGHDLSVVSVGVAGYFTDPDGEALGYTATGLPPGLSIDPVTGVISGTITNSASGATGTTDYAVQVTATDPHGASVVQTFSWHVTNLAPVAVADTFATTGSAAVSGSVATNDSDPDHDTVTFALTGQTRYGTVTFNADGSFRYTAGALFSGVDTFTYAITDANGGTSTATVTISVAAPTVLPPTVRCITTFGNLSYLRSLLQRRG